jgi:hypothetical protein
VGGGEGKEGNLIGRGNNGLAYRRRYWGKGHSVEYEIEKNEIDGKGNRRGRRFGEGARTRGGGKDESEEPKKAYVLRGREDGGKLAVGVVRVGWGCNARSESRGLGGGEGTINDDAMLRQRLLGIAGTDA